LSGTVRGSNIADALAAQRSAHIVDNAHDEAPTIEQGVQVEGTFAKRSATAMRR